MLLLPGFLQEIGRGHVFAALCGFEGLAEAKALKGELVFGGPWLKASGPWGPILHLGEGQFPKRQQKAVPSWAL